MIRAARSRIVAETEMLEPRRLLANAVALSTSNELLRFDTDRPANYTSLTGITGLAAGENIVGIDYRPSTQLLYGVSDLANVYTINAATGEAGLVGNAGTLSGDSFDVDFNPFADAIRVVSNTDQSLRLNPDSGGLAGTDTSLAYAAGDTNAGDDPVVVSAAYSSNYSGTAFTTLYAVDSNQDTLVTVGSTSSAPLSPNGGQLLTVGNLGVDITKRGGFDIYSTGNTEVALAAFGVSGVAGTSLYNINLTTGQATLIGAIGTNRSNRTLADFAVVPDATYGIALTRGNEIAVFNAASPLDEIARYSIDNLDDDNERILAFDFRPSDGELYGISSAGKIYELDLDDIDDDDDRSDSIEADRIGSSNISLTGDIVEFDFNPAADAIRIVTNSLQNFRVNVNTGDIVDADANTAGTQLDGNLAYATGDVNAAQSPTIVGAAYSNNISASPTTTLFGIDSNTDTLVTQGSRGSAPVSPNAGQLFTVGALGVNITRNSHFDIVTEDGISKGYAVLQTVSNGRQGLYDINLLNGRVRRIGSLGRGTVFSDFAIVPSDQVGDLEIA